MFFGRAGCTKVRVEFPNPHMNLNILNKSQRMLIPFVLSICAMLHPAFGQPGINREVQDESVKVKSAVDLRSPNDVVLFHLGADREGHLFYSVQSQEKSPGPVARRVPE